MFWGACLSAICGLYSPKAEAQDYRRLTFEDGREWVVELKGSDTHGMQVEMLQGEAEVSYDDVQEIHQAEQIDYEQAGAWKIRLVRSDFSGNLAQRATADEFRIDLMEAIKARPGLDPAASRSRVKDVFLPAGAGKCKPIDSAVVASEAKRGIDYLFSINVLAQYGGASTVVLCAEYTAGTRPITRWESGEAAGNLAAGAALSSVLGLNHSSEAGLDSPPPSESKVPTLSRAESLPEVGKVTGAAQEVAEPSVGIAGGDSLVAEEPISLEIVDDQVSPELRRLAFVPLPGFPSLYVRDLPRFGRAWVVAVPLTTAAAIWINGSVTFRPGQAFFLTSAAYYAITVGTNQYMARESGVLPDSRYRAESASE